MIRSGTAALAAMGLLAAALAVPAAAQGSGWAQIGQGEARADADHGAIEARGGDQLRQIMFCVEDAPMRFRTVTVRYRGGTTQQIATRERIAAGNCGAAINLRGRDRDVAGVDIAYEAAALGGGTAKVQLYARW